MSDHGIKADINCDMGESFGIYRFGDDQAILDHVTSANIACGFHAGDPAIMKWTVRHCLERGVRIGAHPGLPDKQGFGRRYMAITREEAYDWTVYQIGALQAIVTSEGGQLQHVKPHGALYHMAGAERDIAEGIVQAVNRVDAGLIIFAPPNSELLRAAERYGLQTAAEAFADRRYVADGTLVARSHPQAVIESADEAAKQAVGIMVERYVAVIDGTQIQLAADTICLHGDHPSAPEVARAVRQHLEAAGVHVRAFK